MNAFINKHWLTILFFTFVIIVAVCIVRIYNQETSDEASKRVTAILALFVFIKTIYDEGVRQRDKAAERKKKNTWENRHRASG